jgi:pimeloyl-ACP methyl ester carboxylesterase
VRITNYIYLHGFASSPDSAKAQYLRDRFADCQILLKIPDLNQGDFSHLTITRQLERVAAEFPSPETPVALIGSSLGGLTAAILAQKYSQVQRLVLLAPAFGFLKLWLSYLGEEQVRQWQESGYLSVYHYGEGRSLPLHNQFAIDAAQYDETQLQREIPTLILHGRNDEVIPIQVSRDYVSSRSHVKLIEFNSDHGLMDVMAQIWQAIREFCELD